MSEESPELTVILVPEGTEDSQTYRISYLRLKLLALALGVAGLGLLVMLGSWGYLAVRSSRVSELNARIGQLEAALERTADLESQLSELESQYEHFRSLFGSGLRSVAPDLWLPPSGARRSQSGQADAADESNRPTSWPLTERGFVTQPLLEGGEGDHPGLDIAVPTGSYIRAAGAGSVWEVGEDSIYGRYVVLDHGDGFRTMYAHASMTLVDSEASVMQNEVIALSGSSGRSTAPHLHFEVLLDGAPIDPLTVVRQP